MWQGFGQMTRRAAPADGVQQRDQAGRGIGNGAQAADAAAVERVRELIARLGLPTDAPAAMTPDEFRTLMGLDKKVLGGRLRLVLLRAIGS